jgi:phosphonate transport system permease protein
MKLAAAAPAAPARPVPASAALETFERRYRELAAARRTRTAVSCGVVGVLVLLSAWVSEFDLVKLAQGMPRITEYIQKTLPTLAWATLGDDLAEWMYGLPKWLNMLWETILIAYTATLLGTAGAFLLCFHASQNMMRGRASQIVAKRLFEVFRTIPDLVYALIFVFAFGLGPLAGVLAIAIHAMGANGKLFAEAVENIDQRPVDGLRAAGADWVQTIRYAVLPQVMPNFASFTLWRFELNVRTAAVVGFVGAGGIGQEFYTAIRMLYYEDISAIVLLLVGTVVLIDMACERMRHHLIGQESH